MTQTEEHLTGDGIQVQDDISITIRPAAAWMRNLAAVFLAACGFIGTIAASLSMFSPIYNRTKLILVAAAIFILYSIFSVLPGKLRWLTPVSLAVGTLGFFWKRNVLIVGFQFFYNHFYQQIYDTKVLYYQMDTTLEESTCTTFFLICCIVFFSSCNLLVHDSPTVFSNWVHCDVFSRLSWDYITAWNSLCLQWHWYCSTGHPCLPCS